MNMSYTLILFAVFSLLVPVLVGLFVYRDASDRGMNALLWTLVAVLVPGMLGLIVYLILREKQGDSLLCGQCQKPVQGSFNVCPHCGNALKGKCPSCGFPVESGYRNCPNCATELQGAGIQNAYAPKRQRNGLLIVVLLLLSLLPVLPFGVALTWIFSNTSARPVHRAPEWNDLLDGFEEDLPTLSFASLDLNEYENWRIRETLESLAWEDSDPPVRVFEDEGRELTYIALRTEGYHFFHGLDVDGEKVTIHFHQRERYAQNNEDAFYVVALQQRYDLRQVTVNSTPVNFTTLSME